MTLEDFLNLVEVITPDEKGCKIWLLSCIGESPQVWIVGKRFYGSRVVLEHKLGRNIRKGFRALHSCGNPKCLNPEHIYEGKGISKKFFRKLTEAEIREIRKIFSSGGYTQQQIANVFGISQGMVSHIVLRRVWGNIE